MSYTAEAVSRTLGRPPDGERVVHVGELPFAGKITLVSFLSVPKKAKLPPNVIMLLFVGSYTAVWLSRGIEDVGELCDQTGVPPKPFALVSTKTSGKAGEQLPPQPMSVTPAKPEEIPEQITAA